MSCGKATHNATITTVQNGSTGLAQPANPAGLTVEDYIKATRPSLLKSFHTAKVQSDMAERWQNRVLYNGWERQGGAGAKAYIEKYAKTAGKDKICHLALYAEAEGYPEMAKGFWMKAMQLDNITIANSAPQPADSPTPRPSQRLNTPAPAPTPTPAGMPAPFQHKSNKPADEQVTDFFGASQKTAEKEPAPVQAPVSNPFTPIGDLPEHLQPGKLQVLSPKSSPFKEQELVENPEFSAVPQGGKPVVIGFGKGWKFVQTAAGKNAGDIPANMMAAFGAASIPYGNVIVEGYLSYKDWEGKIHPTENAAKGTALKNRNGIVEATPVFRCVRAVLAKNNDLSRGDEAARLEIGRKIGTLLSNFDSAAFEPPVIARTAEEKSNLVKAGSGGIVWIRTVPGADEANGIFKTSRGG